MEIKHKIDSDATYFNPHLTIIKFPTLEISSQWGGGFTSVPLSRTTFLEALCCLGWQL